MYLFLQRFHMRDQQPHTVSVFVGPSLAWMQLFYGPHAPLPCPFAPHLHHHLSPTRPIPRQNLCDQNKHLAPYSPQPHKHKPRVPKTQRNKTTLTIQKRNWQQCKTGRFSLRISFFLFLFLFLYFLFFSRWFGPSLRGRKQWLPVLYRFWIVLSCGGGPQFQVKMLIGSN